MINFEGWFQFLLITTIATIIISFITEGMEEIAIILKSEIARIIMAIGMVLTYCTAIALIMDIFQKTVIK